MSTIKNRLAMHFFEYCSQSQCHMLLHHKKLQLNLIFAATLEASEHYLHQQIFI